MDGFDAALARYRAFLAHDPITPLLRRSLALLVPGNIRVDTVTADDRLRCTTDGTAVTVGGAEYLLRTEQRRDGIMRQKRPVARQRGVKSVHPAAPCSQ